VSSVETIVIYDITCDRTRQKVAEACLDYGLVRIQYSAFRGRLNYNRRQELELRLRRLMQDTEGNIQFYPICEKDLRLAKELEFPLDAQARQGARGDRW